MNRIINRYIIKEIALPFFAVISVLTFVLLMGKILQVMDLMINKGIALADIARMMLYLSPGFLVFTIPISLLIAILIGVGRLSGDNEWTVLRMAGLSLFQLSMPIFITAFAAFLLTLTTCVYLVPYGNLASRSLFFEIARKKASVGIHEKVFIDYFKDIVLYANSAPASGDFLEGVFISDARLGKTNTTIIARRAYLISDPDREMITLRLENGSTHTVDADLNNYRKADFLFYDIKLEIDAQITGAGQSRKASTEMTLGELQNAGKDAALNDAEKRELSIELHKKIAIPISCLLFTLLAIPLGMKSHRHIRARGFTIGTALVLCYYLLRIFGETMAETGRISPLVGAWLPNLIFAVAGGVLFYISATEHPFRKLFHVPKALTFK
jgi:lipopolysaccharide export system permease protein